MGTAVNNASDKMTTMIVTRQPAPFLSKVATSNQSFLICYLQFARLVDFPFR
jgi:hypothetical protein